MNYVKPTYNEKWGSVNNTSFHCPYCHTYAQQRWSSLHINRQGKELSGTVISKCDFCEENSLWVNGSLIFPAVLLASPPSPDLPVDCTSDYEEARSIVALSPKGAAAILRLCLQKLLNHLGQKGKNINDDIAALVKLGLPIEIQQALDVCRVVGNNAVHPGEIVLDEEPDTANSLFELINFIVENRITQPKKVAQLYANLPTKAKDAIGMRDNK